jgi:hypothetical protein
VALHINFLYKLAGPLSRAWSRRRTRQRIRAGAASPIREIASSGPGPAQIEGHARALETVLSPLSHTRVIGYRVRVELVIDGGEDEADRRRIIDIVRFEAFEVDDGERRALVRAGRHRLLAPGHPRSRGDLVVRLGHPEFEHQLNLQESSINEVATSRYASCREHLLPPDSPVFVCGEARRELDPTGVSTSYREAPSRVVIEPTPREAVLVADCGRDELLGTLSRRFDG